MFNKKYFKLLYCCIVILLWCFCVFLCPINVMAAVLLLEAEQTEYQVGDIFMVDVVLDSQGDYINAVEAKIKFNQEVLQAENFSQGNSVLTLIVEQPNISNKEGIISFSGGTPNGFEGKNGLLGRVVFKAKSAGRAKIEFLSSSRALLNDGMGNKADLKFSGLNFKINPFSDTEERQAIDDWQKFIEQDIASPESFKIYLNQDPDVYGGQYYIIFYATDKQTGVSYYEVKEGDGDWQEAKSPYLLQDQTLSQKIYVKAADKAGNERIEIMPPKFYPAFSIMKKMLAWNKIIIIAWLMILCYILIKLVRLAKQRKR